MAKDPFALETGPDQETTVDLALSTTEIDEKDSVDDDPDSALGAEGNSESHPISGALLPIIPPPMNLSFQPVQMNLSETKSSSQWSRIGEDLDDEKKYEINVDAKVAQFLDKMRNDDRFQISLGSESMLEKRRALPIHNDSKVTFNTDLESSTTLSESKFRQGLDSSFDVSDK